MKRLIIGCFWLVCSLWVYGQERVQVTGVVTDENKEFMPGVSVVIKGTRMGTATDIDGRYTLLVKESDVLMFSMIGCETQNIPVGEQRVINVVLKADKVSLEEVVVTGYGRQERRDITGSVSSVKLPERKSFISVDQMLAGQAPGVFVSASSGALGSANLLTIRGAASILGDNNPLYVIDGVPIYGTDRDANGVSTTGGSIPGISMGGMQVGGGSLKYNYDVTGTFEKNPLTALNPDDIESIEILKDAFATAIYGSRGSAGVILITTKKGSRERTKVDVTYSMSLDRPIGKLDLLNGEEYNRIYTMLYPNTPFTSPYDTDWLDEVTRTAVGHSVSASVSGGTDRTNYFVSASMNDNESYIIANRLKRYSARMNLDTKLGRYADMGVNVSISQVNNGALSAPNIYSLAVRKAPNLPVYDEDTGGYFYGYGKNPRGYLEAYNPVATARENKEKAIDSRVIGNVYLEVKPTDWLALKTELGTDMNESRSSIKKAAVPLSGVIQNQAQESVGQKRRFVVNNTINFHWYNDHHFLQGVLGQSYETSTEYSNSIVGSGFFSPDLIGVGAAPERRVSGGGEQKWALFSAFARVNYQFNRRYMAGVTYRVDGSSRYNKDNRYLGTPSVSLGWLLSEEGFIKNSASWISNLKLRGSVGWSSKDSNSGYYGAQAVYKVNSVNYGGNSYLMMSQPGNTNLKWERTVTYDVGLDATVLNKRIEFVLDYYYKRTTDMLFSSDLPGYTGYSKQDQNIADMQNQGVELRLTSMNFDRPEFKWMTTLNMSRNTNKILKLNFSGNQLDYANTTYKYYAVGEPIAQFFLHEWGGVNPLNGNPQWVLADGTLSEVPPASNYATSRDNMKVCGSGLPTFYGGLTNNFIWKGFELNFMFTFAVGNKMMNSTRATLLTYTTSDAYNLGKEILEAWQMPGQVTDIPKLKNASVINNYDYTVAVTTTRFLENNSYLRLKQLELAYSLPSDLLRRTKVFNMVRVFVAGTNLWTVSPYSGLDPEVSAFGSSVTAAGYDNMTMPQSRSFQFGVRLGF
ncbi:MAG: TonB-dependent receptor [Odoribacter sp.]|nr:TonB-dependent receptor [Odoribacter sp.]